MIQQKIYYIIFICVITIITGSGCEDDLPTMSAPCEWQQNTTPLSVDSCFQRTTFPAGQYLIPPTVGKEIHRIAFDPTNDDLLYFTTWPREGLGGGRDSELYRLDLCEGTSDHVGNLENLGGRKLFLNRSGNLLSPNDGIMTIYDINIQGITITNEIDLDAPGLEKYAWASDSTFWVSYIMFPDSFARYRWVLFDINGIPLDTLQYTTGLVSAPRAGRTVFRTFELNNFHQYLYIYDQDLGIAIDSLLPPQEFDLPASLNNPQWLSDTEVILTTNHMIVVADFNAQTYRVVKEFPPNCDNLEIQSVAVVPSRSNELLYSLQHYFYNEDGEYRKRHEIVHLDISTGEEWVLWVE